MAKAISIACPICRRTLIGQAMGKVIAAWCEPCRAWRNFEKDSHTAGGRAIPRGTARSQPPVNLAERVGKQSPGELALRKRVALIIRVMERIHAIDEEMKRNAGTEAIRAYYDGTINATLQAIKLLKHDVLEDP